MNTSQHAASHGGSWPRWLPAAFFRPRKTSVVIFSFLFLAVFTVTAIFTGVLIQTRTTDILARTDARLTTAVKFSQEMLGTDYHDGIDESDSIPGGRYQGIVDRNTELSRRLGLQYLWSVLVLDDRIVFTSATRTDLNDPGSRFANFFETHADPNAFAPALGPSLEPVYATFTNEWGQGRMVLVPGQDAQGRR